MKFTSLCVKFKSTSKLISCACWMMLLRWSLRYSNEGRAAPVGFIASSASSSPSSWMPGNPRDKDPWDPVEPPPASRSPPPPAAAAAPVNSFSLLPPPPLPSPGSSIPFSPVVRVVAVTAASAPVVDVMVLNCVFVCVFPTAGSTALVRRMPSSTSACPYRQIFFNKPINPCSTRAPCSSGTRDRLYTRVTIAEYMMVQLNRLAVKSVIIFTSS
mmetsp:Transcript_32573/g.54925  ORF Transcript_32573/g.54925 Transcript_32573/m.54925 type:complete len:214 (+) Transcript_32573:444-1085(+)